MQANANLCFTHMLTITVSVNVVAQRDHWKMVHVPISYKYTCLRTVIH